MVIDDEIDELDRVEHMESNKTTQQGTALPCPSHNKLHCMCSMQNAALAPTRLEDLRSAWYYEERNHTAARAYEVQLLLSKMNEIWIRNRSA